MSVNIKSAAVIGCGWFGLPLAQALLASGIQVIGTRRNAEGVQLLESAGVKGLELDLSFPIPNHAAIAEKLIVDALVVSIPPGFRHGNKDYVAHLTRLLALVKGHSYQSVIFVSSTGVYPNEERCFDEASASEHSELATALLQAEALFLNLPNAKVCRFAGLVGPKRHPGRFFGGKSDIAGANASVNLVHLDDCVRAVHAILTRDESSKIYNICAPKHPNKQVFYTKAAKSLGLPLPEFNCTPIPDKRINGDKLMLELDFAYRYSDPLSMLAAC